QVRADVLDFGVVVLEQQHKAQVGVLQLVLVARILAHTACMPALSREVDNGARLIEQAQQLWPEQATVELADGINAAVQQADFRQVNDTGVARVYEQPTIRVFTCQHVES